MFRCWDAGKILQQFFDTVSSFNFNLNNTIDDERFVHLTKIRNEKKKKMVADTIGEINNWKIYLKKNLPTIRFFSSNIFVFVEEKYRSRDWENISGVFLLIL